MERGSAVFVEPVAGIERQQLDLAPLGQIGRFVEDKSATPLLPAFEKPTNPS